MSDIQAITDKARQAQGFFGMAEMVEAYGEANDLLDPHSILISPGVELGTGNVIYPGVTLARSEAAVLRVGSGNILHNGTDISAETGKIVISDKNLFGPGGVQIGADRIGAHIRIGSNCRLRYGARVFGKSTLGDGCQVLGAVEAVDCQLGSGGSHEEPDPDKRGGVLKGFGRARDVKVPRGFALAGEGTFDNAKLLPQSHFHPKPE